MKEEEIRPQRLFDELIRLATVDAKKFFPTQGRASIACPACQAHGTVAFEKDGFTYEECASCRSLYANPRPPAEAFERYYLESQSSKYWATTFYRETMEARREKLWKPKAQQILGLLERYGPTGATVYDIGGGYGVFAEEMCRLGVATTVIEPAPHLAAICRDKGLETIQSFLEGVDATLLSQGPRAFVSFELFEHLHDPASFLRRLAEIMGPQDVFTLTTLSGSGVDIRVLWENSKSVMPPYHINFLNPYSMRLLLGRLGFEVLEISTPGKLDVSILENNRHLIQDHFWKMFIDLASSEQKDAMQHSLAENGWSSHMMVTCRKGVAMERGEG